jgi:hypothetical protein
LQRVAFNYSNSYLMPRRQPLKITKSVTTGKWGQGFNNTACVTLLSEASIVRTYGKKMMAAESSYCCALRGAFFIL